MTVYKNINELKTNLEQVLTLHGPHLTIHNSDLAVKAIDKLIYTSVFSNDELLKAKTRKIIHSIAYETGAKSRSIRTYYKAIGEEKLSGFTVPAMNLRMMTYDVARVIFRVAKSKNASAFVIEIAKTESEYTNQPPNEFVTVILAAAIKENYTHPVFIQGDHCQFSAWRWKENKETELNRVKAWIDLLIDAGIRNIDIDGSTLVDLTKPSLYAQQKDNAFVTAEMTKYIREIESKMQRIRAINHKPVHSDPKSLWISDSPIAIGGEIGHIGEKNSSVSDFEAFMHQYLNQIARGSGINKVSIQTGTSHGGVINADGSIQKMSVDFSVLNSIGKSARAKYKMAGPVQHGASTLPMELFHKFVESGTAEIHLSTGFQNLVYDRMPKKLKDEMYAWLKKDQKKEWKTEWTEDQFIYKTRKKAWGPFKKQLWNLPEDDKKNIIDAMEEYVGKIFDELNIAGTKASVEKYTL